LFDFTLWLLPFFGRIYQHFYQVLLTHDLRENCLSNCANEINSCYDNCPCYNKCWLGCPCDSYDCCEYNVDIATECTNSCLINEHQCKAKRTDSKTFSQSEKILNCVRNVMIYSKMSNILQIFQNVPKKDILKCHHNSKCKKYSKMSQHFF